MLSIMASAPHIHACPSLTAQEMRRNLDPEINNQKGENAPVMQKNFFP